MNKKQTEWVTNLHNHPLAVVNSFGAGIYAPICSNELSVKHLLISGMTEILVLMFKTPSLNWYFLVQLRERSSCQ